MTVRLPDTERRNGLEVGGKTWPCHTSASTSLEYRWSRGNGAGSVFPHEPGKQLPAVDVCTTYPRTERDKSSMACCNWGSWPWAYSTAKGTTMVGVTPTPSRR